LKRETTDLGLLRDAVVRVNASSDVSSPQALDRLVAGFDATRQLEMYRFFLVAFDAAPGQTYWGQLKEAVEAGLSTRDIVNIFTTKEAFQSVYPDSLSNQDFALRLVESVVKKSASSSAKSLAVAEVVSALGTGMSRGDVIYNVFGNLAARPTDPTAPGYNATDPYLGVAKQLANKVAVAEYYTETLLGQSTRLSELQSVVGKTTDQSDVSSAAGVGGIGAQ